MQSGDAPHNSTAATPRSWLLHRYGTRTSERSGSPAGIDCFCSRPSHCHWLARPPEVEFHSVFIRPLVHDFGDELAAIIDFVCCRQATICCNPDLRVDNVIAIKTLHQIDR